ncbi:MAG: hypothetical protein IS860_06310 [Nitrosopumilus sp.]|nr:hypothetical protein [Nitrosopumilus sp.]
MRKIRQSVLDQDTSYDENVIQNWIPHMSMSIADHNSGAALTAAQVEKKRENNSLVANYFVNPMQDLDYIVIEAMLKKYICRCIDECLYKVYRRNWV